MADRNLRPLSPGRKAYPGGYRKPMPFPSQLPPAPGPLRRRPGSQYPLMHPGLLDPGAWRYGLAQYYGPAATREYLAAQSGTTGRRRKVWY